MVTTSSLRGRGRGRALELSELGRVPGGRRRRPRTAFVFGPERSGLTEEELARASACLRLPTEPDFPTMNLSHAVAVVLGGDPRALARRARARGAGAARERGRGRGRDRALGPRPRRDRLLRHRPPRSVAARLEASGRGATPDDAGGGDSPGSGESDLVSLRRALQPTVASSGPVDDSRLETQTSPRSAPRPRRRTRSPWRRSPSNRSRGSRCARCRCRRGCAPMPGSAFRESVAPMVSRRCATASARSSAATTTGALGHEAHQRVVERPLAVHGVEGARLLRGEAHLAQRRRIENPPSPGGPGSRRPFRRRPSRASGSSACAPSSSPSQI